MKYLYSPVFFARAALLVTACLSLATAFAVESVQAAEESGSVGVQGRISAPPPTQAATITFPRDGSTITDVPVTVTGLCPNGLLVKIFKNNVFGGSAQCANGSYSIQIDLFGGRNELVARVFDDLDQQGPDSNVVVVTFPTSNLGLGARVSLTSSFAKKGANPAETLIWPITLSGGVGPYAVTVDWGDGKPPDVISQQFAGNFNISHIYDSPGVYTVIVRASDKNGEVAFLQLVGIANGALTDKQGESNKDPAQTVTKTRILWQPAAIAIPLIIIAFWLGKRHQLAALRKRLGRNESVR